MTFKETKAVVSNRGCAPDSFLTEQVEWARSAPDDIFAPNTIAVEIYSVIKSRLGTPEGKDAAGVPVYHWDDLLHRKAALLEAQRVHALFESSCKWDEGVDRSARDRSDPETQESGAFQVSFDSTELHHRAMLPFAIKHGIDTPSKFIPAMKADHALALEYYSRLVRGDISWAGPLIRNGLNSVYPWLRRPAMSEYRALLAS